MTASVTSFGQFTSSGLGSCETGYGLRQHLLHRLHGSYSLLSFSFLHPAPERVLN